jgi:hypothetical protein
LDLVELLVTVLDPLCRLHFGHKLYIATAVRVLDVNFLWHHSERAPSMFRLRLLSISRSDRAWKWIADCVAVDPEAKAIAVAAEGGADIIQ